MNRTWSERLYGQTASLRFLMLAAVIMLFTCLGGREIWTQEHRWADIVSGMFYYHDFLHPYLNGNDYYDKPLLSYWMIAGLAVLLGKLNVFVLRLPSALAGLLGIWSIYSLGCTLKDKRLGLLAGWMLLTTFYFLFWARTSSADMLNMAGTLFAVAWYFAKKPQPSFFNYAVFFLILAVTALCKGLIGPVVAGIVILPDLLMQQEWKRHLRLNLFLAMIPAAIIYVIPFWASSHFGGNLYGENGLTEVYRENILRYFQPFDHKGPIYTYFVYLPVYLLPWTIFFIPALFAIKSRWKTMTPNSKWLVWSVLLLFVFFTISGSRRNYYILPVVPFALLLTADWVLAVSSASSKRNIWSARSVLIFFAILFMALDVVQPLAYYGGGNATFADDVKQQVEKIKPWSDWNVVLLDPESKVSFYLNLSPQVKNYAIVGDQRSMQTQATLEKAWPFLLAANHQTDTIYITRKQYESALQGVLTNYEILEAHPSLGERFMKKDPNLPVAFIPKQSAS